MKYLIHRKVRKKHQNIQTLKSQSCIMIVSLMTQFSGLGLWLATRTALKSWNVGQQLPHLSIGELCGDVDMYRVSP